jgi:hypothetical protein
MNTNLRGIIFLLIALVLCGAFATMQCDQDSLDMRSGCKTGHDTICMKGGTASIDAIVADAISLKSESESLRQKIVLL